MYNVGNFFMITNMPSKKSYDQHFLVIAQKYQTRLGKNTRLEGGGGGEWTNVKFSFKLP